jgi:PPOX class probable F420-dependent enzyme
MPNSIEIKPKLERRLRKEQIIWLTTVRADGTPQPTPVWFLWEACPDPEHSEGERNGTFLIYTQPNAHKLRNIAHNPRVALNLNSDESGGEVAIFTGEARIDETTPPANKVAAYVKKYRQGIAEIDMTPDRMAQEYCVAIRVIPTRVRAF